jgi:hypothetical protein
MRVIEGAFESYCGVVLEPGSREVPAILHTRKISHGG